MSLLFQLGVLIACFAVASAFLPVGVPCNSDAECFIPGFYCVEGSCDALPCISNTIEGCPFGLTCTGFGCAGNSSCSSGADCHPGLYCIDGKCEGIPCYYLNVCPAGFVCNDGLCKGCTDENDCPSGQTCNNGRCEGCLDNNGCPPGFFCDFGECVVLGCVDAMDCQFGETCINGICEVVCNGGCSQEDNKICDVIQNTCVCKLSYSVGGDGQCTRDSDVIITDVIDTFTEENTVSLPIPQAVDGTQENLYHFCALARTESTKIPSFTSMSVLSSGRRIRHIKGNQIGTFHRKLREDGVDKIIRVRVKCHEYEVEMEDENKQASIKYVPITGRKKTNDSRLVRTIKYNDGNISRCLFASQERSEDDESESGIVTYEGPSTITGDTKLQVEFGEDQLVFYNESDENRKTCGKHRHCERPDVCIDGYCDSKQFCVKLRMKVSSKTDVRYKIKAFEEKDDAGTMKPSKKLHREKGWFKTQDDKVVFEESCHFESRFLRRGISNRNFNVTIDIMQQQNAEVEVLDFKVYKTTADNKYPCISLSETQNIEKDK